MDIAQLGVLVDSTSAVKAAADLDSLTVSATAAASANERLAGSATSAAGAQSAASSAAASTVSSTTSAASAADRLIASLQKQIELYAATDAAIASYNAAAAKATEAQTAQIEASAALLSQLQAEGAQRAQYYAQVEASAAAGDKFIASLTTQAETIGLTKTQLLEYKAAQLGVSEAAAPIIASIEAQTAALTRSAAATTVAGESADAAAARYQAISAAALEFAAANSTAATSAEGLATANAAVGKSAAEVAAQVKAQNAAMAQETVASKEASVAAEARAASLDKIATSLEREIVAVTATKSQLAEYDAAVLGATEQESAYIVELAKEVELRTAQIALGKEMAKTYLEEAAAADVMKGSTSSVTTEILVLLRELGRGDLSRFGGSLTRLISLAGATSLLFNPLTLAVLAFGAAAVVVANQNEKLNQALILTGDYAGRTSDELHQLAESATAGGATIGVATQAITELAASGRVTGQEIGKLGTATADAATYTGVSVKQMVADFTKLQEEPLKASVKLNEQYHYLTVATYDQIDALVKQGDTVAAVQVAQDAFADEFIKRSEDLKKAQGPILDFWDKLKATTSEVIHNIGQLGAPVTPQVAVDRLLQQRAELAPQGGFSPEAADQLQRAIQVRDAAESQARAKSAADQQAQDIITAKERKKAFDKEFWTPQQHAADDQKKYLDQIATPLGLSTEQQLSDIASINAKYKDKKTLSSDTSAEDNAQFQQDQAAVKNQYDVLNKLNQDQGKILDNDHKARLVSDADFYAQQFVLNDKDLQYKLSYYARAKTALEEDMADSSTGAAAKIKDQTEIDKLNSDALVALSDYVSKDTEIRDKQKAAINKSEDAVRSYADALNKQYEAAQKAAATQVGVSGQGTREAGLSERNAAVQHAAADEILKLQAAEQANPEKDKKTYDSQIALAQANADRLVALNNSTYDKITAKQEDWVGGAETAWKNWADSAGNVSGQVGTTLTTAINGATDALTTFVTTGKLSFTSLADSVIKDLIRIAVEQAELKLVSSVIGAFSGGTGAAAVGVLGAVNSSAGGGSSVVTAATGGYISGPGSGTSDSISAKLSNGEFVVNAAATAANRPMLEALNGGKGSSGQTHFATGGFVGSAPSSVSGGSTSIVFNISNPSSSGAATGQPGTSTTGQKAKSDSFQKELESAVLEVVRKHSEPGGQVNKIIKQVVTS